MSQGAQAELRIFLEVDYQFCSKKVGPYGKVAWCRHLGLRAIFDDDSRICNECFVNGLPVFPIVGKSGDHQDLMNKSEGIIIPSHNLGDAINQFLER